MTSRTRQAATAAVLLLAVWSVLLAGARLAPHVGEGPAICGSFLVATLLLVAARGRVVPLRPARAGTLALFGLACGGLSYPAWIALIAAVGRAIGLAPVTAVAPTHEPLLLLATLVLAPLFEEILYRERLLRPLVALLGWPAGCVLSSVLFALPHVGAWGVLGTFLVGLALSASRRLGSSLAFCIGAHAGLNLAALSLPGRSAHPWE